MLCIGLLANLILDFSSFRYKIVGYENFLSSLATIYLNSSYYTEQSFQRWPAEEISQNNVVQLKVLQVIKNFMFNEAAENKKEAISYLPLSSIFEKASFGLSSDNLEDTASEIQYLRTQQKIVAFEILRNFTGGSPPLCEILKKSFATEYTINQQQLSDNTNSTNFASHHQSLLGWNEFVYASLVNVRGFLPSSKDMADWFDDSILSELLLNDDYVKYINAINFTEDHLFTNVENFEKELFPSDDILKVWLRFLRFKLPKQPAEQIFKGNDGNKGSNNKVDVKLLRMANNLNSIKLSIGWILGNLTWKSSVGYYDPNDYDIYEVYQTVDQSIANKRNGFNPTRQRLLERRNLEFHKSKEAAASAVAAVDEMTVFDRAQYLHDYGFTHAITDILHNFTEQRLLKFNKNGLSHNMMEIVLENEAFEKLRTAFLQISYLLKLDMHKNDTTIKKFENNAMKLHLNPDNSNNGIGGVGSGGGTGGVGNGREKVVTEEDESRYERSRRREAINSEDEGDNDSMLLDQEEEAEEEEDDDVDDVDEVDDIEEDPEVDEEEAFVDEGENTDSDDEIPHEYWVM